ncbi:tripartite motif-containing protein 3-like [Branchiostoma lanceolatum]|uniref:tripartite motif-containing protein 3-like n=1 Tax=Branchiostoma lanceolatum TaxID=7740 RepID=UPI003453F9CF
MAGKSLSLPTVLQQELICELCEEIYSTPKVLPCLHTFCQDCLEERAKENESFDCPVCEARTELTPEAVNQMPENTAILALCDRIHNQAVMPELVLDSEEEEEAKYFTNCDTHETEKLQLYCVQCKVPTCTECLDEMHAGHRMMTLRKALDDRKAAITAFVTRGKDLIENYCSFIAGLRETEKSLHEQKQQAEGSIIQAYEQMIKKLTDTKETMLRDVNTKHQQNLQAIRQTRDPMLTEVYELSVTCDAVKENLEQTRAEFNDREKHLIQVVGMVTEKVARAPTPLPTPPLTPLHVTPLTPQRQEWDT